MDRDARQGRQAGLGVHLLGTCPGDMDAPSQPAAMEKSAGSRLLRVSTIESPRSCCWLLLRLSPCDEAVTRGRCSWRQKRSQMKCTQLRHASTQGR